MSEDRPRPTGRPGARPARVRVTGPPRHTVARATTRVGDVHDQTPLGDLYLSSLLREQLGLAARVLAAAFTVLGVVPLLFWAMPSLAERTLFGIDVAWVVLGGFAYPFLMLLGWAYVRRVERNEAVFADLVQTAVGDEPEAPAPAPPQGT